MKVDVPLGAAEKREPLSPCGIVVTSRVESIALVLVIGNALEGKPSGIFPSNLPCAALALAERRPRIGQQISYPMRNGEPFVFLTPQSAGLGKRECAHAQTFGPRNGNFPPRRRIARRKPNRRLDFTAGERGRGKITPNHSKSRFTRRSALHEKAFAFSGVATNSFPASSAKTIRHNSAGLRASPTWLCFVERSTNSTSRPSAESTDTRRTPFSTETGSPPDAAWKSDAAIITHTVTMAADEIRCLFRTHREAGFLFIA